MSRAKLAWTLPWRENVPWNGTICRTGSKVLGVIIVSWWRSWKINNYCCPVKLFQTKQIRADTSHEVSALLVIFRLRGLTFEKINPEVLFYGASGRIFMLFGVLPDSNIFYPYVPIFFAVWQKMRKFAEVWRNSIYLFSLSLLRHALSLPNQDVKM